MNPIEEDQRQAAQMTERQRQRFLDQVGTEALGPEPVTTSGRKAINGIDPRIVHSVHEDEF